jgi:putative hydrolase of the HAD superfamily
MSVNAGYRAVLFDFGGVFTTSPFEAFARYEAEHGLPKDFIRQTNARNHHDNAWAKMERNDVTVDEFAVLFEAETAEQGYPVSGHDVLPLLAGDLRPEMVRALDLVNVHYKTACLTNNMKAGSGPGMARTPEKAAAIAEVMTRFDFVVQSSEAGIRKPEQRFYEYACETVGIKPNEAVFLDDLGVNLKTARAMGMTTIKVSAAGQAISDLEEVLGLDLR